MNKFFYYKYRNLRSKTVLKFFKSVYKDKFIYSKGVYVRKNFILVIDENGKVEIGKDCFFNSFCSLNSLIEIKIGNNCIFGENVHIYDHNHIYSSSMTPINDQGFTYGKVDIGDNTWIGSNVTILKGVHIGTHCVIGAGCVIYKDIPDNSIVFNGTNNLVIKSMLD